MQESYSLIGKPLITLSEGRIIGKVDDFYFNSQLNSITAIRLSSGGVFSRKITIVEHSDVELFGVDAVFVKGTTTAQETSNFPDYEAWIQREAFKNRPMDTPGGTKLGTIGDLIIDSSGQVLGFKFGQYFVQGTLAQYGSIIRQAVIEVANNQGIMTINLSLAEQYKVGNTVPTATSQINMQKEVSDENNHPNY